MRFVDLGRIQAASSELARDINRRIVLNLIRTRQPISRAYLARASGLQRSTISLIVETLIADGWVIDGPTGRLPRGRRPTFLRLNEERLIVGVDIRPIQTTLALANVNGSFLAQEVMVTPAEPRTAGAELAARIQALLRAGRKNKVEGIGISLPGRFSGGHLVFAPNLKWRDYDLGAAIAHLTGLDVVMENAATACVLAAAWFGGAEDCRNVVVVTVSEGLGTGLLVNGQLVRGMNNMAGEFGHVTLDPAGPVCGCGNRGCWEVFASNRAALRYYAEDSAPVQGLSFTDLLSRADQGDTRAADALNRMARALGRGMRMIVAGLAPERIIVIGDLTRSWSHFGPVLAAEVQAQILPGGRAPAIVPDSNDGLARLRGTVALVLQKHFEAIVALPD
jgi:predicted NBD/HSP70 family sugar kinase